VKDDRYLKQEDAMIIQCEKCRTKFNLDESLLKNDGSKVRCSLCKHVFMAYPPEQAFYEDFDTIGMSQEELEGVLAEEVADAGEKDQEVGFDAVFEETLEDLEKLETISSEDLDDFVGKEAAATEETIAHTKMKKEPLPADIEEEYVEGYGDEAEVATTASVQERRPRSRFLPIFLVIIFLLTGTAAVIYFWAPELIPDFLSFLKPPVKQEIIDMGTRRLSFHAVDGSFVDSEKAGKLFVVRGMVKNGYPKSRSFILIKVEILDDKGGQVVRRKLAYAGNNFKNEEIKVMSMEEIGKAMKNRYGMGRKNFNVPTNTTIPFMAVFEDLPKNLGEFTVEAASSSPGLAEQ
jgi:predicted Zn finger-like uncharacterized protein